MFKLVLEKAEEPEIKFPSHYVSKFGKLSSGHTTGKGQFSFQSHGVSADGGSGPRTRQVHDTQYMGERRQEASEEIYV